jgi:hypothetical protein
METTWILIIIGLLILFFLFTNTIYITTSTVQTSIDGCGVSKYGCCPDKITTRMDALGNNCSRKAVSMPPVTSPPATTIQPTPYVAQNVANTTPYPPNQATMLVPISIPPPGMSIPTPLLNQQQLPPKAVTT